MNNISLLNDFGVVEYGKIIKLAHLHHRTHSALLLGEKISSSRPVLVDSANKVINNLLYWYNKVNNMLHLSSLIV